MRGFELTIDGKTVSGALEDDGGITSVLISNKEGNYTINFSSLNSTGMVSHTWFSAKLETGSKLTISAREITEKHLPVRILDYNDKAQLDKLEIEGYYRLKQELIDEGLLEDGL